MPGISPALFDFWQQGEQEGFVVFLLCGNYGVNAVEPALNKYPLDTCIG